MRPPAGEEVVSLEAGDTYGLRRHVLRGGDLDADVAFRTDAMAGSRHLGWRDGKGCVVAVASIAPQPLPLQARHWFCISAAGAGDKPERIWQLRGMAVAPSRRGEGIGTALLEAAESEIAACHGTLLWCNARDTALGLYRARGWEVGGQGFISEIGVTHHVAVRRLSRPPLQG